MRRKTIPHMMGISDEDRDKDWLIDSLQTAIQLEHATLPLYLTPLWTIRESGTAAGKTINGITLQEMKHMGLACNMLTTIGGSSSRSASRAARSTPPRSPTTCSTRSPCPRLG